ncbi:MAG: hypothetical protein LBL35_09095 [Clostridiales bacterium]|jgi:hypothetical protein|nr:hypothetical protein [Clostridiales bacterium]
MMFDAYYKDFEGGDDEAVFWFAMALNEWKKGRLSDKEKKRALKFIEAGEDPEIWSDHKDAEKRKKTLDDLKLKLLSEQPAQKMIKKPSSVVSGWKAGDLLALKIKRLYLWATRGLDE